MIIFITLLAIFFAYLHKFIHRRNKLPPGPFALPIIGNGLQLGYGILQGKSLVEIMQEWAKEYGPVFTFWVGPRATVNLVSYEVAHEAMVKNGGSYVDRDEIYMANCVREGRGIVMSNGHGWMVQRRFALQALRNLGLGRNIMEQRIMEEFRLNAEKLDSELAESGKLTISPHVLFDSIVSNTINRMLFSRRFEEGQHARFLALKEKMDDMINSLGLFDLMIDSNNSRLPFIRWRMERFNNPQREVLTFLRQQVDQRKSDIAAGLHDLGTEAADYVDAFLMQMRDEKVAEEEDNTFTDDWLAMNIFDLWLAGQETTATTLTWAFNYLLLHPEVMQKLRDEIISVTGGERPLTLNDRANTPYYNALILEVLRLANLLPLNIWRRSTKDTVVGGHAIPEGTAVVAQISMIMHDGVTFSEPQKFKPERFIEGNEDPQRVVPFGMGKRACLGESLARTELYLIIANLVQRYNFSIDDSHPPSMKSRTELATIRKARPYNIVLERIE